MSDKQPRRRVITEKFLLKELKNIELMRSAFMDNCLKASDKVELSLIPLETYIKSLLSYVRGEK